MRSPAFGRRTVSAVVVVLAILGGTLLWAVQQAPTTSTAVAPAPSPNAAATTGSTEPGRREPPAPAPATSAPGPVGHLIDVTGWHVPVLMYHLIDEGSSVGNADPTLVVSPALFAAQLSLLRAAGWQTITAAALAMDLGAGRRPAPRTFVITIDDGNQDGFSEAFPILRTNGFIATFYVVTGRIGHPGDLTQLDVQALAAAGMEIADHTIDHLGLAVVAPLEAAWQIDGAATWIAKLLGAAPTTLAYPYGNEDPAVVADVAAEGFSLAVTTVEGCAEATADRFLVPRLRVGPWTTPADLLAAVRACDARQGLEARAGGPPG